MIKRLALICYILELVILILLFDPLHLLYYVFKFTFLFNILLRIAVEKLFFFLFISINYIIFLILFVTIDSIYIFYIIR